MKINNKAFTLIELLAVIVILAIIALIATPIVLNIIKDSRESSGLRSAEMYLDAVEQSVSIEKMENTNFNPSTCTVVEEGNLDCEGYDKNPIEVEVNGEVPETGKIIFENGQIKDVTLNYSNDKTIIKNIDGKLVYGEKAKTIDDICTYDNTSTVEEKKAGAKYKCKVKEQMETEYKDGYTFYVLTTPKEGDTTINLIMDQNINSDGTPAGMAGTKKNGENVYNLVAWLSKDDYKNNGGSNIGQFTDEGPCQYGGYCSVNQLGPLTAMQFLYNATKDWTNISPVNYTYNDRTVQGNADGEGYTSFVSSNGVATITPVTGDGVTIGSEATPLRARMPICSSNVSITEVADKTDANAYLYDNFKGLWISVKKPHKKIYNLSKKH